MKIARIKKPKNQLLLKNESKNLENQKREKVKASLFP